MNISASRKILDTWILIWVWWVLAGWGLSALGMLNTVGYAVALLAGIGAITIVLATARPYANRDHWNYRTVRAQRLIPALYFIGAGVALLSGLIHEPNQYDAITYRLPRLMFWWSNEGWYWIDGSDRRMNYSGTAMEWQILPIIVLLRTTAPLFLLNFIPFLFLPGLLFAVFRRLGVTRRIAWLMMWLLPLSYVYLFQAAGIGNDSLGAFFILAAFYYALQARESGRSGDVLYSILCAALLTGIKTSNVPLGLPWLVVILPVLPKLANRPAWSAAVIPVAIAVSFVPIALLSHLHTGHWSGDPENLSQMRVEHPPAVFVGNVIHTASANLAPPALPYAREVAEWTETQIPDGLHGWISQHYPRFTIILRELPQEENSPLGLITVLLLAVLVVGWGAARGWRLTTRAQRQAGLVSLAALVAMCVAMAQLGSESIPRLLAPYYNLIALGLLAGLAPLSRAFHRRLLLPVAALYGIVLLTLVLSPSRPLWPWQTAFQGMREIIPSSSYLRRAETAYHAYALRHDALRPLRHRVPGDGSAIAYTQYPSTRETPQVLWYPYDLSRQLIPLTAEAPAVPAPAEWVLTTPEYLQEDQRKAHPQLRGWEPVATHETVFKIAHGPNTYILMRRGPEATLPKPPLSLPVAP